MRVIFYMPLHVQRHAPCTCSWRCCVQKLVWNFERCSKSRWLQSWMMQEKRLHYRILALFICWNPATCMISHEYQSLIYEPESLIRVLFLSNTMSSAHTLSHYIHACSPWFTVFKWQMKALINNSTLSACVQMQIVVDIWLFAWNCLARECVGAFDLACSASEFHELLVAIVRHTLHNSHNCLLVNICSVLLISSWNWVYFMRSFSQDFRWLQFIKVPFGWNLM